MKRVSRWRLCAPLAWALAVSSGAGWASDEASPGKGFASLHIEGASETATYSIDGRAVTIPYKAHGDRPLVVKAGRHVIEVREGENVALHEEVVLEPGETRTLRVKRAEPE